MNAQRITWLKAGDPPDAFPHVDAALSEPEGLLAAGGDLGSERLLTAYRRGIFPWYDAGQPILWWSPNPRCVLRPGHFHVSKRLRRDVANSRAVVTFNRDFRHVVRACAAPRPSQRGTWITAEMMLAYERLHSEGWAHSVEVREGDRLAGGVYGVIIGKVFFGESMFSRKSNGSKFALLGAASLLAAHGFELIDCQVPSSHLLSLGAELMRRGDFVNLLTRACNPPTTFHEWPHEPQPVSELQVPATPGDTDGEP